MKEIKNINQVKYKMFGFNVKDEFLTDETTLMSDINYFIQVPVNINNVLNEFYTILVDLKESEQTIWGNIYHRTQSEIKSFTNNQKFEHQILFKPNQAELNLFIDLFDDFAKEKKIRKAEKHRINAYNISGILAISYIKEANQFLCVNFYRINQQRATNLYSFHNLKSSAEFNQTHIGRAHRTLHWLDIIEFKKLNINYYDFCGWYEGTNDEKLLSINKFKEQYSKNIVKEYSGVIYKNKFLLLLKKLKFNG